MQGSGAGGAGIYWDGLASQTNTPVVFDEHNLSAVAIVLFYNCM